MTIYLLRPLVFDRGPGMAMETKLREPAGGCTGSYSGFVFVGLFIVHNVDMANVV